MAPDRQEWTVPTAARALLWWPATAFVLVVVAPETASWSIALAGLLLGLVGVAGSLVTRLGGRGAPEPRTLRMPDAASPASERRVA
ncbi:MAG TPA: hypothetical protein VM367_05515 [Pseudonocardia sp.]|nr:hypothetical protein [Pseudonocardia sp.]